jgi:arsenite-transporting ATPase
MNRGKRRTFPGGLARAKVAGVIQVPQSAQSALQRRILLLTGKGGVGRSTWASVLARQSAAAGARTLLAEISEPGQAYSPLARLFGMEEFEADAQSLGRPLLSGVALSPQRGQQLFLSKVIHVEALAKAALASEAIRKLLDVAPSFRELGVYYHLLTLLNEKLPTGEPRFERVIIDLPATGHTLALTGLPEILGRVITRGPISEALAEGQRLLNSDACTSAWVVTLPEPLPVSETLELIEGLQRTRVPVGGVIVNRLRADPFDIKERAAIREWLEAGQEIPGSRLYSELEENRRALARLDSIPSLPLIFADELDEPGASSPRIADGLTQQLQDALDISGNPARGGSLA